MQAAHDVVDLVVGEGGRREWRVRIADGANAEIVTFAPSEFERLGLPLALDA